jgi:hypothetical protein
LRVFSTLERKLDRMREASGRRAGSTIAAARDQWFITTILQYPRHGSEKSARRIRRMGRPAMMNRRDAVPR